MPQLTVRQCRWLPVASEEAQVPVIREFLARPSGTREMVAQVLDRAPGLNQDGVFSPIPGRRDVVGFVAQSARTSMTCSGPTPNFARLLDVHVSSSAILSRPQHEDAGPRSCIISLSARQGTRPDSTDAFWRACR
jgi:hypothetical protein